MLITLKRVKELLYIKKSPLLSEPRANIALAHAVIVSP